MRTLLAYLLIAPGTLFILHSALLFVRGYWYVVGVLLLVLVVGGMFAVGVQMLDGHNRND